MSFERSPLSFVACCLAVGALALLAVPTGALAAPPGAAPAIAAPQAQPADATGCSEPAVASPAIATALPLVSVESLLAPSLEPNPCYQFDNPSIGCYYKWRPSDFCCISPAAWCPSICY